MNKFDLMREAFNEAREVQRAADSQANVMASMLTENQRLRSVYAGTLIKLKKQLKNFNMSTGHWKD